jgi:NADH dehydrogenase
MKRIVILGGGYGGVEAGKTLEKSFRRDKNVELLLIDKNPFHTLMTEIHEVAGGRTPEHSVKVQFNKIFTGKKLQFIQAEIKTIDFSKKELIGEYDRIAYDYLILGTGAEPDYYDIPGVEEHSLEFVVS